MMIQLDEVSKIVKFTEAEQRMVAARGLGEGEMGNCWSVGIKFHYAR